MHAYDALPPAVRQVLADAPVPLCARDVLNEWQRFGPIVGQQRFCERLRQVTAVLATRID